MTEKRINELYNAHKSGVPRLSYGYEVTELIHALLEERARLRKALLQMRSGYAPPMSTQLLANWIEEEIKRVLG